MAALLADQAAKETSAESALGERAPHFAPRAKRIIMLFMFGGPSHLDTFDPKPLLTRDSGQPLPDASRPRVLSFPNRMGNLVGSPFSFRQHGQSGAWVSELYPELSRCVDDLCFVHSMHCSNSRHGGAVLEWHTGSDTFVRPSLGSWIGYGLGNENQNLPGYITICPALSQGGTHNFGAGFLPAVFQGTPLGQGSQPASEARFSFLDHPREDEPRQRRELDLVARLARQQLQTTGPDAELEGRIESFELAFRMQTEAPYWMDISRETAATQGLYGLDHPETEDFGRQCLLARRFSEAGVRFVQCTSMGWDSHNNLQREHGRLARATDQPIAALLRDLKQRGLLDETLVIWGGEFGRTPTCEGADGRDHNPHGFTMWLAGAGVKPGIRHGRTDDYGYFACEDKVHFHDLHATILHLLGLDHQRLTYRHAGRDFRLTDVHGEVVHGIIR